MPLISTDLKKKEKMKRIFVIKKPKSHLWSYVGGKAQVLQGIRPPVRMIYQNKGRWLLWTQKQSWCYFCWGWLKEGSSSGHSGSPWICFSFDCVRMQRWAPLVMDPDLPTSSMVKSESRTQWAGEDFHSMFPLKREKQRKYWEIRQSRKPSLYFQHLFHRIIATNQK